ncbi:hypothetical protein QTP88_018005 [Uroleucon formosanum]
MSSKGSFTIEEYVQLAECVSRHPCLYDLKNPNYKDQQIRDNVWKLIADTFKKSVDDSKKRWKNMKDMYNRNKRNRKLGTGSSTKNKRTKWALADTLSFLDVCSYERTELTNFNHTNEMNDSEEEDTLVNVDDNNSNDVNDIHDFSHISATETITEETELENIFTTEKRKLLKEKRPTEKIKQDEEFVSLFNRNNDERQQILNALNKVEEDEDPIDLFFKTIASTVKSFPQHLKIKAKKEVFNIITDLEIENNCSSTSTSNKNIQSTSSLFSYPNSSIQSSSHSGFSTYNRLSQYIFPETGGRQSENWTQPFGEPNYEPLQFDDSQYE